MTTARLGHDVHGPDDAPVLVLGSSVGSTRAMWDPNLGALAERFRVVRYDHRGHGDSQAPPGPYTVADLGADVLALLDSLGVQRFRYAGLSLGGMVGMWLGVHAPDRVEWLALCCTSAYLPPAGLWQDRVAAVRAGGMESVADAVVARWFTPGFAAERPDEVARLRAVLAGCDVEGYAGCCLAIAGMDQRDDLSLIAAPTLVLAGAQDPATPPSHAEQIADAVPGARMVTVDAAHLATVERADECTALLLDFLAGTA
jgi:3-oxoadipate enol-lactonase